MLWISTAFLYSMVKNLNDDQDFPEVVEERGFLGWKGKKKFTDASASYYGSRSVWFSGERTVTFCWGGAERAGGKVWQATSCSCGKRYARISCFVQLVAITATHTASKTTRRSTCGDPIVQCFVS